MKIIIDPRSSYSYGSFYLLGLEQLYGKRRLFYDIKPFKKLTDPRNNLRFIIVSGSSILNVFIQADDSNRLYAIDYEWCDIYGSVNANFVINPKECFPKLVSLAPSFGVRNEHSFIQAFFDGIIRFLQTWRSVIQREEWSIVLQQNERNRYNNVKHFFSRRFKGWKHRLPLSAYTNDIQSEDDYIFFLSTLWYSDDYNKNDENVNLARARFIRACRSIDSLVFEGGLVGEKTPLNKDFHDLTIQKRIPFPTWLEKTKRSSLVFNTPAFWGCHGWKLGEYLALGKCIISTPLINNLPYPLEHGRNVHFVDNSEQSMSEAINYIISHPNYRHTLEQGARSYWEEFGTPAKSLNLLGLHSD